MYIKYMFMLCPKISSNFQFQFYIQYISIPYSDYIIIESIGYTSPTILLGVFITVSNDRPLPINTTYKEDKNRDRLNPPRYARLFYQLPIISILILIFLYSQIYTRYLLVLLLSYAYTIYNRRRFTLYSILRIIIPTTLEYRLR